MDEEKGELDVEIAGQKLRTKGFRLADLAMPVMAGAILWIAFTLWNHDATAQNDKAAVAATLAKSNLDIANTLKENTVAITQAIKDLTIEQRRSTIAIKEGNCLQDPTMKNRADARDFCKRLTRDDR